MGRVIGNIVSGFMEFVVEWEVSVNFVFSVFEVKCYMVRFWLCSGIFIII